MAAPLQWLRAELDDADPAAAPRWTADLHACAQATGWTLSPWAATSFMTELRVRELVAPYGAQRVEMRAHGWLPLLAFVAAPEHRPAGLPGEPWEPTHHPYINPPALAAWWQTRGWVVPDAAWLNGRPTAEELAQLSPREGGYLKRLGWNRGDALLLYW
ncbi:hypothetical protein [Deinococcus aquaedulcis]|uniref:hypothetical protein n=1 Tax=Deinococcus aquaedulcis TaxID=2840455 RepID=UPI001C83161C|nr:hypothetical protein [Deinococcus aquaedulcis]